MVSIYGLFLIIAVAVGCAAFYPAAKREGFASKTLPVLAALCVLVGAVMGRLYLHVAKYVVNGMGFWGYTLLSDRPYEYAACGTVLGVMLAGFLTAKLTKQKAWRMLQKSMVSKKVVCNNYWKTPNNTENNRVFITLHRIYHG